MAYGGELRANTAVDVLIGPFVDDTDGKTAETGLTIDVEVSKLGQALANKSDATAPVHDAAGDIDGYYNCELDATDTNTEGTLTLVCYAAGALPVRMDFMVLAEAAWDSKYVAKDDGFMDVNIKTVGRADTQETEANNLESACANYSATRGLAGTALPAAVADAAGGLPISDAGGLDLDAQRTLIGDIDTKINTIDGIVDDILVDTGTTLDTLVKDIPTNAELTTALSALNDITVAEVMAGTVDGATDVTAALKAILAKASGNIVKSGNAYVYKDRAGNTLFTLTIDDGAGTVTRS